MQCKNCLIIIIRNIIKKEIKIILDFNCDQYCPMLIDTLDGILLNTWSNIWKIIWIIALLHHMSNEDWEIKIRRGVNCAIENKNEMEREKLWGKNGKWKISPGQRLGKNDRDERVWGLWNTISD